MRGVNAFGVGPASAEFTLTINANGSSTPLPPTSLVAWTSASRLTATWVGPAAGPTPTSFVLEAGSATGASNIGVIEVPATAFTFESVPPGFYFLRVRSKFGGVLSATTAEAMINVGNVPAPPIPRLDQRQEALRRLAHRQIEIRRQRRLVGVDPIVVAPARLASTTSPAAG